MNKLKTLILSILLIFSIAGCKKDIKRTIQLDLTSNVDITYLRIFKACDNDPNAHPWVNIPEVSPGVYSLVLDESFSNTKGCLRLDYNYSANSDTVGDTQIDFTATDIETGHIAGFQNITMKRPHTNGSNRYFFSPQTVVE
jgi:hypothetical protein